MRGLPCSACPESLRLDARPMSDSLPRKYIPTHPSFKVDPLKTRSPLKIDRGIIFEVWPFWAFFGPARPRDQGETLPRTRFTPSAPVRRSGDPNRTMLRPKIVDFLARGPRPGAGARARGPGPGAGAQGPGPGPGAFPLDYTMFRAFPHDAWNCE